MVKDANAHLCGRIPLRIPGIFNTPAVVAYYSQQHPQLFTW